MAKAVVKTFSVTVGGKINLGNYNSLQVDQTRWVDVIFDEGEEPSQVVVESMIEEQKNLIRAQISRWAKEKGDPNYVVQEKEYFAGKPVDNGPVYLDDPANEFGGADDLLPNVGRLGFDVDLESGLDPRDGMPFGDK